MKTTPGQLKRMLVYLKKKNCGEILKYDDGSFSFISNVTGQSYNVDFKERKVTKSTCQVGGYHSSDPYNEVIDWDAGVDFLAGPVEKLVSKFAEREVIAELTRREVKRVKSGKRTHFV